MKLPIETWIEEQHFSDNIAELFHEAVICYQNGAYRASLLTTYIGFLSIIKDRMNRSKLPADFVEAEWQTKLRDINNHDKWENAVFDSLKQGTSASAKEIFRLSEDIKQQLAYWRSRRNDAAHYKDNEINGHYTEAFWSFIKSNVPKMAVNGGLEGLLNKFSDHFNDERTIPGTDVRPLIREIPSSILTDEYAQFFPRLKIVIDGRMWYDDAASSAVFNEILNLTDERVITGLQVYLKDEDRDLRFLNVFPARILHMGYDTADIREIWKKRMFNKYININPFTIYCGLLRENLIPPGEITTVNTVLFDIYDQQNNHKLPMNETDISTLISNGFFNTVFDEAIIREDLKMYLWVNKKCDLIAMMVEYCPVRVETVRSICKNAQSGYPSEWLIRELQNLFIKKPGVKQTFISIASQENIPIPSDFD
ncbi:hypothetical protein FHW88_002765 [Mucilaginibacter sp. SG538B]|uniref:hypothetical protein n=1 Tax=Mucilaginibacter sp. SG538B TaxID=2587021 RepID=UPI00159CFC83|nr:hypothetical protein [Mucilaginibacter sp. SG538B]NVM64476.1 hypothetical protein [Mucilaginibacter sp. SG538B]